MIDPNLTDEVRITVIATGFQSRMAVEASTSSGHARPTVKKAAEHQMTLPMHSQGSSLTGAGYAARAMEMPSQPQTLGLSHESGMAPTVAPLSAAPPVSEPLDVLDTEVDIDGPEPFLYPPLPSLMAAALTPAPVYAPSAPVVAAERFAPAPDSRPVIRPAVSSPIAAASATSSARRVTSNMQTGLSGAHLGIEESEFDKPTYLRRAMAGEGGFGTRLPGDGKA